MGEIIFWWVLGFAFSMLLGCWLTKIFLERIRESMLEFIKHKYKKDKEIFDRAVEWEIEELGVVDHAVGIVERGFFTIVIAFWVPGAAVAMISWIMVKMVTNWHQITGKNLTDRGLALCSLMASLVSMFFALIGGLFCRYGLGLICQ